MDGRRVKRGCGCQMESVKYKNGFKNFTVRNRLPLLQEEW